MMGGKKKQPVYLNIPEQNLADFIPPKSSKD